MANSKTFKQSQNYSFKVHLTVQRKSQIFGKTSNFPSYLIKLKDHKISNKLSELKSLQIPNKLKSLKSYKFILVFLH